MEVINLKLVIPWWTEVQSWKKGNNGGLDRIARFSMHHEEDD